MHKKAVVLCSGGLDSTTVLAVAQSQGYSCYAMSFDYGQRNRSELAAAREIAVSARVEQHKIVRINLGDTVDSALTDSKQPLSPYKEYSDDSIPTTYVPARNTVFLAFALGWAETVGAYDIFIGVSAVDYSNYPDCRPEYIKTFNRLAELATKAGTEGQKFNVQTPLIHLSKAQTVQLGLKLGIDYSRTVSCYQANVHGHACGICDSCGLRKKGFLEADVPDPTRYQSQF